MSREISPKHWSTAHDLIDPGENIVCMGNWFFRYTDGTKNHLLCLTQKNMFIFFLGGTFFSRELKRARKIAYSDLTRYEIKESRVSLKGRLPDNLCALYFEPFPFRDSKRPETWSGPMIYQGEKWIAEPCYYTDDFALGEKFAITLNEYASTYMSDDRKQKLPLILRSLHDLHLHGALTDDEFHRAKELVVGKPISRASMLREELINLKDLRDKGVLTEAEYKSKKWDSLMR